MIPEIGHFILILALCVAALQGTLPIIGAARGDAGWMSLGRSGARLMALLVGASFACLAAAFLLNDFSVLYVASHSNSSLPAQYRFAAVWGGHEGSILLWVFILTLWMLAVANFSRHLPEPLVARTLGVMGLIALGLLAFILFTSNPFERLFPAAPDGRDLNPLLQDPGMVIHPPLLYMGYVGFSVAFAFGIAALIGGELDATWARWSRPWTTVAWAFLTLGIAIGSNWAYYELGWGGWWFWDPVENASFMPWLVGTALIHSLAVTDKRGAFRAWTVLLAILAFALSLLGTFLVCFGVLTSVHAFATDPKRGVFILMFLAVVVGASFLLYASRASKVTGEGGFALVSRESMLLGNNVLLLVACAAVLLGTLYPLVMEAFDLGKISVGPPYFESVFAPLMAPVLFLMGVGVSARWKKANLGSMVRVLRWAGAVALLTALLLPFALGKWTPLISFGVLLAAWVIGSQLTDLWLRLNSQGGARWWTRFDTLPRTYWGMLLAHIGVAVFVIGVTFVKGYESEKDVRMAPGDTTELAGHSFRFMGVQQVPGPNYTAWRGEIEVSKGSRKWSMFTEKRVYTVQQMPMTEAGIDTGITRDLYVALGEPLDGEAWSVRVHHKPFIIWIWAGCVLMAAGGVLAITDRRYRVGRSSHREELLEPVSAQLAPGVKLKSGQQA